MITIISKQIFNIQLFYYHQNLNQLYKLIKYYHVFPFKPRSFISILSLTIQSVTFFIFLSSLSLFLIFYSYLFSSILLLDLYKNILILNSVITIFYLFISHSSKSFLQNATKINFIF